MDRKTKELVRQARNEYQRHYRATHKEKIKAINDRYWTRKALKMQSEQENKAGE